MPVFRRMTENDVAMVATLEKENFTDAWSEQSIIDTYRQKNAFVTVAELDENLVGYCIIYFVLDEGEIARIAVADRAKRQDIGKRLLDYTCACCLEQGVERLLLDVREQNAVARAFYQNYGFEEDGIRRNFYDNPKEDAILMSKTIA